MDDDKPQRLDPARVTEVTVAGGLLECVLLMRRTIFAMVPDRIMQETVPVAAVTMPWPVAKQVCALLTAQIEKHENEHGPITRIGDPTWQSKPN